jgi:hypothetical protein
MSQTKLGFFRVSCGLGGVGVSLSSWSYFAGADDFAGNCQRLCS